MYTYRSTYNVSILRGAKIILLLGGLAMGASKIIRAAGSPSDIFAQGQYSPLHFPYSQNLTLAFPHGGVREMKSFWRFRLENRGSAQAREVSLELPFEGFYRTSLAGSQNELADFDRKIVIGSLDPSQQVSLMVWTDSDAAPNLETETKINHQDGSAEIEYPVQVTGFWANVERYKSGILFLLFIFFLVLVL